MNINNFWTKIFGIFGILGGITLFAGDMLFYYDPINTNLFKNMGNASDSRIIYSAVTALLASWFYLLGVVHVYQAFKPSKTLVKNIIFICFAAITISYGVVHGAFVAIATSSKLAIQNNLDLNESILLASEANNVLRLLVYPIFGLLSVLFIYQVWKKKYSIPKMDNSFFSINTFSNTKFYM